MGKGAGEEYHDCLVTRISFARVRTVYVLQCLELDFSSLVLGAKEQ